MSLKLGFRGRLGKVRGSFDVWMWLSCSAYYRNTGVVGLDCVFAAHVLWPLTSPQLLSPRVPPSCFFGTLDMHLYGTGAGPCTHTVLMEGAVG